MKSEELKRALAAHLQETKTKDLGLSALVGGVSGLVIWFVFTIGGVGHSGGVSPTLVAERVEWPVFGAVAGVVSAGVAAWAFYRHQRQRRQQRFWDQVRSESELTRGL